MITMPVTPMDVKRARFFGLTIPAPEIEPTVNPRDAWPERTDERWTITPEPALALAGDDESACPTSDAWMNETIAIYLTHTAMDLIEEGDVNGDQVDELWLGMEEENKRAFRAYLRSINSPATGWSTWLSLIAQGSPVSFPKGPRPTYRFGFAPSKSEQQEASELLRDDRPGRYTVISGHKAPVSRKPRPTGSDVIADADIYGIDPWGNLSDHELMECRGRHPAAGSYGR